MAEAQAGGLLDLEKELTCSICTDILYEPLTLLDCLHTFCGSCLKDWFSFQASTAKTANPYTCPSCRASVRDTKRNAQVTTLLDIYLQANPGRRKSEEERQELGKKYRHGENVLQEVQLSSSDSDDDELMENARLRSLQEVGVGSGRLRVPRDHRRTGGNQGGRDRSRDSRHSASGHHRDRSRNDSQVSSNRRSRSGDTRVHTRAREAAERQSRHIEHQSSLRSLISSSDVGSDEEEELMRQILQEIDLNNLDPSREDEINRAVSVAYRRHRHHGPTRRSPEHIHSPPSSSPALAREAPSDQQRRQHARSQSTVTPSPRPSRPTETRPPVSRPHLFETTTSDASRRHRRSSSQDGTHQHRHRSSSDHQRDLLPTDTTRPAARSATDLSERPESASRPRRISFSGRSSTDPDRLQTREVLQDPALSSSPTISSGAPTRTSTSSVESPRLSAARRAVQASQSPDTVPSAIISSAISHSKSPPALSSPQFPPSSMSSSRPHASSAPTSRRTLYIEPSISCYRCNKPHIEYDLHYNCPRCEHSSINLCMTCYRTTEKQPAESRGCLHWYGFGYAAKAKYQAQLNQASSSTSVEPPHTLIGHRYLRPRQTIAQPASASTGARTMTDEDPSKRLQQGVFCDICLAFANSCYWKCDICNYGAWGFCHSCVNQGRHCTHPLLPIAQSISSPSSSPTNPSQPPSSPPPTTITTPSPPIQSTPLPTTSSIDLSLPFPFHPLTFTTTCDICHLPIPPSSPRHHCNVCNAGDYDICLPCYTSLVSTSRLSPRDGEAGWRRCLKGHRMCVIGFEDDPNPSPLVAGGQWRRRVVLRERKGGWRFDDGRVPSLEKTVGMAAGVGDPAEEDAQGQSVSWRRGQVGGVQPQPQPQPQYAKGTAASVGRDRDREVKAVGTLQTQAGAAGKQKVRGEEMQIPPDGGTGLRLRGRWTWFPEEGVENELMFPPAAEIREAVDVNGDWFWGVYCGRGGLFPGGYVGRA
ncbi:MAG: hypothetical protein M1820_004624 [Bogoriella megaspora]|nr:MAG: hypothetical protein M1820_004624 [Bogoriella megaspora]